MRVLVTGTTGFIGRHLMERLQGRYDVVALDLRDNKADSVFTQDALRNVDAVVHLAGMKGRDLCSENLREAIAFNVVETGALVAAARLAGVRRFIFASTYMVYGRRLPNDLPSCEGDEIRPSDLYAMTKALAEQIVQREAMDSTILRLGHVYGPDPLSESSDVVSRFLTSALQEGIIHLHGSGSTCVDPIYVDDVCECIERLLRAPSTGRNLFNVASGSAVTIRELAEAVHQVAKKRGFPVDIVSKGGDDSSEFHKAVSVDCIHRFLPGFRPRGLSRGLEDCMEHIQCCQPSLTRR